MRGHVDAGTLAAFREDLLPRRRTTSIAAHLAGCPQCSGTAAGLASVTTLLSSAPLPPMPAAVAARLDAALAEEATRSARAAVPVPLPAPRESGARAARHGGGRPAGTSRSRVALKAIATAAVVAVLGGGGYALAGQLGTGAGSSQAAPSAARALPAAGVPGAGASAPRKYGGVHAGVSGPMTAARYPVVGTGTDYQPGHLRAQVSALLRDGTRRSVLGPRAGTGGPTASASVSRDLPACVSRVTGGHRPQVVDVARYAGRPAAVIVVPGSAGFTVWVVGAGCSGSATHVIARLSLPKGS